MLYAVGIMCCGTLVHVYIIKYFQNIKLFDKLKKNMKNIWYMAMAINKLFCRENIIKEESIH